MTVKEFAAMAEISGPLAYALLKEGRIPHRRLGRKGKRGKITIDLADAQRFLQETRDETMASIKE